MQSFIMLPLTVVSVLVPTQGTPAADVLPLVKDGEPVARIVLPYPSETEESRAAHELQTYLGKMTGIKLSIVAEGSEGDGGGEVHIGRTKFVKGLGLNLEAIDIDGFVIKVVDNRLVLCGRELHGTEFAVYRFLQKYGGVRWYIPTELGEHVPRRVEFTTPQINDVEQPDFLSRQWSSAAPFDDGVWEKRNLMWERFNFHHNLLHVFTPDLFEAHPEWFPLRDGARYKPQGTDEHGWQPCMSNLEAAKYAGQVAARHFEGNPKAVSFSLGVNDSRGYCECDDCQSWVAHGRAFRGRPDYSDLVFTFLNRAAEELVKTHLDKFIGCLAYSWCENTPSFPVHPHIIPYLTNDRAQWRDPDFKRLDQELIRRWMQAVPIIGIYDYYYGSGYVIPRIFTRLSAESLKFCKGAGVRGFYAEIYSNWSLDGPKTWAASQLLWDTDGDLEALLLDFYTNFFGKAAAPMRAYFELCEGQWMGQKGKGEWFRYFFDPMQLELFPPDVCVQARRYLNEAMGTAEDELIKRRVKLYAEGFRYTKLYATLHYVDKQLTSFRVQNQSQFEEAPPLVRQFAEARRELDCYYREVIMTNPLHKPVISFTRRARWEPGGGLSRVLLEIAEWGERSGGRQSVEQVLNELERAFPDDDVVVAVSVLRRMRHHSETAVERLQNPSLEDVVEKGTPPEGPEWDSSKDPPGWGHWIRPGTKATLTWTNKGPRTGAAAVKMTGVEGGASFQQSVDVKSGELYMASVFVKASVIGGAKVQLRVQWQDAQGSWLNKISPKVDQLPTGETKDPDEIELFASLDWQRLVVFFRVPDGVERAVMLLSVFDQSAGDFALFDDASLQRVDMR